jgi:hypothetical protein
VASIKDLQEKIKISAGYDSSISKKSGTVLIVETSKGEDRKEILRDIIAPLVGGEYVPGNRLKSTAKSSKGGVIVDNITIIAKEVINGKTVSQLDARTFTVGAKKTIIDYNGNEVSCYVFSDAEEIEESIIKGCLQDRLLGENIADTFADFFKNGFFTWGKVEPETLLNKIGVYAGELLSGWVLLRGQQSKYMIGNTPFKGKAKYFYLPDDPSFNAVDSIVDMADGNTYAISSKFDRGAAASLFANVLPGAIKRLNSLKNNTLKELATICKKGNIDPGKNSKKIVYEWGVNYLLGMNIRNPEKIADIIRAGKTSPEQQAVCGRVMEIMKKENDPRYEKMPYSLSSFFNRKLAEALTEDSKDDIISIVSAKSYYQLNLDKKAFIKGELKFHCVKAGDTEIIIKGNKSSQDDITCKQGWVNYEIVKK